MRTTNSYEPNLQFTQTANESEIEANSKQNKDFSHDE